jgi:hypothetical protein
MRGQSWQNTQQKQRGNRGEASYAVRTSGGGENWLSQLSLRKAVRDWWLKVPVERGAFLLSEIRVEKPTVM